MPNGIHHVYVFASTRSGKSRVITPELLDSLFESGAISFVGDSQKFLNEELTLNHPKAFTKDDCAVIFDGLN
jgi:hypothetical protein